MAPKGSLVGPLCFVAKAGQLLLNLGRAGGGEGLLPGVQASLLAVSGGQGAVVPKEEMLKLFS